MSRSTIQDLRVSLRRFRRDPVFTAVALVCLTLAVGANTAVFSVLKAVVVTPLPFPDSDRLYTTPAVFQGANRGEQEYLVTPDNYAEMRKADSFSGLAAVWGTEMDLTDEGEEPERVQAAWVTPDLFRVLGSRPVLGRTLEPGDAEPNGGRPVVISEGLWRRRYGADRTVVGRDIRVDGEPRTVLGVVPSRGGYPLAADLWAPFDIDTLSAALRTRGFLATVGRLADGVDAAAAQEEMDAVASRLRRLYASNAGRSIRVRSLESSLVGDVQPSIRALMVSVILLLAIACANLAGLMLVRLHRQTRELAVRSALGAVRGDFYRRFLVECLLLGGAGGAMGLLLAWAGLPPLLRLVPPDMTVFDTVRLDGPVLAFTAALTLVTVLAFGLAPAVVAPRTDLSSLIRAGGRGVRGGRRRRRLHDALALLEVALGILLLVGAGLTLRSLRRLEAVDPGFRTSGVVTARLAAPQLRYPTLADRERFFRQVEEAVGGLPGVERVGAVHSLPMADPIYGWSFAVEDQPPADPDHREVAFGRIVTPGYFKTLGTPLVRGRLFTERDAADAPPVVIVSRALADRFWPGEDPIGKRLKRHGYYTDDPWLTVVGVVGDVQDVGLGERLGITLYRPYAQTDADYARTLTLAVRTRQTAASLVPGLRAAVASVDPSVPIFQVRTIEDVVAASIARQRLIAVLLALFAAIGVALAAAGIYGVLSQMVTERRPEIAIRMAVGATPGAAAGLLVWRALRLAAGGLALGLLASTYGASLLSGLLYETRPLDPAVFAAVPLMLLGVALVASVLPAWRASRIDPVRNLRSD